MRDAVLARKGPPFAAIPLRAVALALLLPLALALSLALPGAPRAQGTSWRATTDPGVDVRSMFSLGLTCAPILRTYYESLAPAERDSKRGRFARDQFATMEALIDAMAGLEGFDRAYVRQAKDAAEQRLEKTLLEGDYFILLRVCLQEADEIVASLKE